MEPSLVGENAARKTIFRRSTGPEVSSYGLDWKGFAIQEYRGEPGEQPETVQPRHVLGLWRHHIATGERPNGRGGLTPYARYPGKVTLIPPSVIPKFRAHNSFEVMLCLLEPSFVKEVEQELDHRPSTELLFRANVDDRAMRQLITLLAVEAGQGGTLGRLYADHLAHAIAARLFCAEVGEKRTRAEVSALPPHLMRRVKERMHDVGSDPDLQALAAETGYSRHHFLRMFRAATGSTPHRYLLQLRLERAQDLLQRQPMSLIDIAASCGFSSHAHMTRAFRQMLGVTPSEYRRNL